MTALQSRKVDNIMAVADAEPALMKVLNKVGLIGLVLILVIVVI